MPMIENHAEHAFEAPAPPRQNDDKGFIPGNKADGLFFPPARPKAQPDGKEITVPGGPVSVSKERYEAMRSHPVQRSWFGPNKLAVTDGAKG